MLKKFVLALTLVVSALTAHTAPNLYSFQWTGAYVIGGQFGDYWAPDYTVSGSFVGEDLNHDNLIAQGELNWFALSIGGTTVKFDSCRARGPGVSGWTDCQLSGFLHAVDGGLSFSAGVLNSQDGRVFLGLGFDMPNYAYFATDHGDSETYLITDQTTFSIVKTVPEPSSWAMLTAGLLLAGVLARRQPRKDG